jgi:acyl carrier protein
MGLDVVELILAVEDGFQIHIEDEEAGRISTVGDLHDLVTSKLTGRASKRCFTSAAFYRTRRGIVDVLGVKRREIRPSTSLEAIFPEDSRRTRWHTMQEVVGLELPALVYPGATVVTFMVTGLIAGIAVAVYTHARVPGMALAAFVGLVIGAGALRLLPGSAVAIPNGEQNVGDLARDILALNHAHFGTEAGGWNDGEVWETLCRIIVIQTGVDREVITREARIVDDLGID